MEMNLETPVQQPRRAAPQSKLREPSPPGSLLCLSHLRWDFVFQRPQHLMTRWARERAVYFYEEPVWGDGPARLEVSARPGGVQVVVPHLPTLLRDDEEQSHAAQRLLLDDLLREQRLVQPLLWYYTPMMLPFTRHLPTCGVVYDCMDELSAFVGAPPALQEREAELLSRAHAVFTGGMSLYEAKRHRHRNIHPFPSSIDVAHFAKAREPQQEPEDQRAIPHPRMGFFGVIDERMDLQLLDGVAALRPDLHLVLIGPVVKIDPAVLPRRPNIHYLGQKSYQELPAYLAGWDVAMLPFARNAATRFISPTKTPEYLAAHKPVVSTSIRDVVRPYGEQGLVLIADTPEHFVAAARACLEHDTEAHLRQADRFLAHLSWDNTFNRMRSVLEGACAGLEPRVRL